MRFICFIGIYAAANSSGLRTCHFFFMGIFKAACGRESKTLASNFFSSFFFPLFFSLIFSFFWFFPLLLFFFSRAATDLLYSPISSSRSGPGLRAAGARSRCPSALQRPRSSCTGYQICAFQCWLQIAGEAPTLNQCTK